MFQAVPNGQRVNGPSNDSVNLFVDCGAIEPCMNDELIQGFHDMIYEYDVLDERKKILTADRNILVGRRQAFYNGVQHRFGLRRLILPKLGHSLFSPLCASPLCVSTIIEEGSHHLCCKKGAKDYTVPLQQLQEDLGCAPST